MGAFKNDAEAPRERLQWPGGTSGASKAAWGCFGSVRNGLGVP